MDLIEFYFDNQATLNFLIGIGFALLANKYALKDNIKKTHAAIEELDMALTDDKITLEERERILGRVKDLVGEEFIMMVAKAVTKTQ